MCTGRRWLATAVAVLILTSSSAAIRAERAAWQRAATLTCGEIEEFLRTAKVGQARAIPVGVTAPLRATLAAGNLKHDAAIQTADMSQAYTTLGGTELNFRDTWKFNVAGYELAKMLHLNMVPPYVERRMSGKPASLSWWVDDAIMERDRVQKKITPPDMAQWSNEMHAARLFRELVGDYDFNQTNTLMTKDGRVWMIDFTRAFRAGQALQSPQEVTMVDRTLLGHLRMLNRDVMREKLGKWLTNAEIDGVLARRDTLVALVGKHITAKGEAAVLYDLPRVSEPCGTWLDR